MKRTATHGEDPLNTFALIVIGLEMLIVAAITCYAFTEPANAEHAATWFGEHAMDPRGPTGK